MRDTADMTFYLFSQLLSTPWQGFYPTA
ncbi:hypothetical protein QNH14_08325 [Apirhabdus apintestini]|nr:hypothetical protein QNH14_08325 [Enterobacteriaceae bacterium CA-0114]